MRASLHLAIPNLCADGTDTKAKELLGWNPTVDIIEYIKDNYVAKNH